MYRKINGKYIRQNGTLSNLRYSNLLFTVRGPSFLNWLYVPDDPYSPVTVSRPQGYLSISSTKPNKVTINYGDGVVEVFDFIFQSGNYSFVMQSQIDQPPPTGLPNAVNNHAFTDGNITNDRVVNVSIQYPEYIIGVSSNLVLLRGKYPMDIDKFSLIGLTTNYAGFLDSFPDNITNIKTLQNLSIVQPSQNRLTTFPDSFLGLTNLKSLSVGGVFDFADPIASGLFKLGNYGSQLLSLSIPACRIGITETDLPVEFLNLTSLTTLSISANNFETTPPRVNQMTWLIRLDLGGYSTENVFNDWGNFSALVNLTTLTCSVMQVLPPTLPSWFNSLVKLKALNVSGTYHTLIRQNAFVDNFYDFITTNASISGANTLPFRGMAVSIYLASIPSASPRPSGTFQQPSGYVTGVSNGIPASQMEKIWVMTNQYGHTWTVNPS